MNEWAIWAAWTSLAFNITNFVYISYQAGRMDSHREIISSLCLGVLDLNQRLKAVTNERPKTSS